MTTYCNLLDVKNRLKIVSTETTFDDEIDEVILEAQVIIDEMLRPYETVPLTVVPTIIRFACADLAAGSFKARKGQEDISKSGYYLLGEKKVQTYIQGKYFQGGMHEE